MFLKKRNRTSEKYKKGDVIHVAFDQGMATVVHSVKIEKVKDEMVYLSLYASTLSCLVTKASEMIREGEEVNAEIERQKTKRR